MRECEALLTNGLIVMGQVLEYTDQLVLGRAKICGNKGDELAQYDINDATIIEKCNIVYVTITDARSDYVEPSED